MCVCVCVCVCVLVLDPLLFSFREDRMRYLQIKFFVLQNW